MPAMENPPRALARIDLTVNGRAVTVDVPPERALLEVLRDDIGLTGTKAGCLAGVCGLCSVLVDGTLTTACLLPAVKADGRAVTTIEGIAGPDGTLSPVQDAFIARGGFQCGICTPGQVIAATALLAERPQPSEADVVEWMTGNLCRCTGYYGILEAVLAAASSAEDSAGIALERRPAVEVLDGTAAAHSLE